MTISKTSAIALASIIAVGVASPVLASPVGSSKLFDADYYLTQLRYDGVNAIAADEVTGSTFRATIQGADGHTVFEFFDKDSLQPVKSAL